MTNHGGTCFVSYRRQRHLEIANVVASLKEHGVPTWQDTTDLAHEPTEETLRKTLRDPNTASALLWLTPEVESSRTIREIEIPEAMTRYDRGDGFFCVPVAAGRLSHNGAEAMGDGGSSPRSLRGWNIHQTTADPASERDVAEVARAVLRMRLDAIHAYRPTGSPLKVRLHTFEPAPPAAPDALVLDWSHHFQQRHAAPESWSGRLLPALDAVGSAVSQRCPGRPLEVRGRPALSAAFAFGYAFREPRGIPLTWIQESSSREPEGWRLGGRETDPGFQVVRRSAALEGTDVAALVSVSANVEPAFNEWRGKLPLQATLHVSPPGGTPVILKGSEAAGLARSTIRAARETVAERRARRVHLFMAAPAGFAVLLGQLANTLPPIQTYELHPSSDAPAAYAPAITVPWAGRAGSAQRARSRLGGVFSWRKKSGST